MQRYIDNKIEIYHSHIRINNYELGDSSFLEYEFSTWDPVCHTRFPCGIIYNEEQKQLYLPRGYDINTLESEFGCEAVVVKKYDEYDTFEEPTRLKYGPKDDTQVKAIKFMLGLDNHFANKNKSQLSLNLNTGKGKTYVSIYTICYTKCRACIITASVNWLNQWKAFFLEYCDVDPNEVFMLVGSSSINKILKNGVGNYKYFLATHATIKAFAEKNGWEAIGILFKRLRIGIKIYDEAHLNFDNMCLIDAYTNTKMTYYVTATPNRSDRGEDIIYQKAFHCVPKINLFNENEDPHTSYTAILYNSHPTAKEISMCRNQYGFDRNAYYSILQNKGNYYRMVILIVDMALRCKGKVLIYIGTNEAIQKTYNFIMEKFPGTDVGIYTSTTHPDIKKQQLDKKIILSTTKSSGAASDIPDLKMTVVLAESFKSQVTARQTLGRTRDDNTRYIECVDVGMADCMRYYKTKASIFKVYATQCQEIKLTDDELKIRTDNIIRKYWPITYTWEE